MFRVVSTPGTTARRAVVVPVLLAALAALLAPATAAERVVLCEDFTAYG